MKVKQVVISASLVVSAVALAQAAPAVLPESSEQRASTPSESLKKLVPTDPQQFARRLHRGNQREIRLSKLAQQKADSPKVKELARTIAENYGKADQQLVTLARSERWNLQKEVKASSALEIAIDASTKAEEAKLAQLDGAVFDSAYLTLMVGGHDLKVARVTLAAQRFKGSGFAKELDQLAPILQQHRDQAYLLLGELRQGQPGVGGAGMEEEGSIEPAEPMEDQMGKDDPGLPAEDDTQP